MLSQMGLIHKRQGQRQQRISNDATSLFLSSIATAQYFFEKALEVNPNDGHSLVQLASLLDYSSDVHDNNNDNNEIRETTLVAANSNWLDSSYIDHNSNHHQQQQTAKKRMYKDIIANSKSLDDNYVATLFNGYSSRFETELLNTLHYKGHLMTQKAVEIVWNRTMMHHQTKGKKMSNVIDLGCGTGLLGQSMKHLVYNSNDDSSGIIGVDLSERMAEIASSRKDVNDTRNIVYKKVFLGDAMSFLSRHVQTDSVDCIVASDVFIYVGDLKDLFQECARCLNKHVERDSENNGVSSGLLGFTVELYQPSRTINAINNVNNNVCDNDTKENRCNADKYGMRLLKSGRFGHTKDYITEMATLANLEIVYWNESVLRQQGGNDVPGAACVLRPIL